MLDPAIWEDADFGMLTIPARLLFIGMISHADDEGIGDANPLVLRRAVFGFDHEITVDNVSGFLEEIDRCIKGVVFYVVGGKPYYILRNWKRYQKVNHPTLSRFPRPPMNGDATVVEGKSAYMEVWSTWEKMTGTITGFQSEEILQMMDDWNGFVAKLPEGHPSKSITGSQAVLAAFKETATSIARPNLKYVKAILNSWKEHGFMAKRGKAADAQSGPKSDAEAYTPEELAKLKRSRGKKKGAT